MLVLFFLCGVILLFYTYLGYPLFFFVLNKLFYSNSDRPHSENYYKPSVSILVAAYNEEKVIQEKIENCSRLDYPQDLLNIWIASDGSVDKTNEIVNTYSGKDARIHLLEFSRTGKSGILNKAMTSIKSDIVVFSDANTLYANDVLNKLVMHFSDKMVGCVCGRLIYRNPGEVISGKGESFYWRYETALKKLESTSGYVAGANGAIYAIRRELFEPLPSKTINDDFMISMQIVKKGYKCLYEENAIAYEDVAPTMESEFNRHVRDGAGHYLAIYPLLGLLNPFLGMRSLIYWSHRFLRWAAPFILILLFIANGFLLERVFYKGLFILHVGFYLLAIVGLMSIKSKRLPFFMYIPFYFCNLNLALLVGFINVVTGRQKTTWERTERT